MAPRRTQEATPESHPGKPPPQATAAPAPRPHQKLRRHAHQHHPGIPLRAVEVHAERADGLQRERPEVGLVVVAAVALASHDLYFAALPARVQLLQAAHHRLLRRRLVHAVQINSGLHATATQP